MIRYVNVGERFYGKYPVLSYARELVEFQAILSGQACPAPKQGSVPVESPCLWVHPAGSAHGWTDQADGRSQIAVFHFQEVHPVLERILAQRGRIVVPLSAAEAGVIQEMAEKTLAQYRTLTPQSLLWYEKVRVELSLLAVGEAGDAGSSGMTPFALWKVEEAVTWYRERVHRNPGVEEVSRAVGVSGTHLRRLFQQVKGATPGDVFRRIRMAHAQSMVLERRFTLAEISDQLGFSEPSAFSRAYRKQFQVSPTHHRE